MNKLAITLVCVATVSYGQFIRPEWDEQPEELREIYLEMRELSEKCRFGLDRVREPLFVKRVIECKKRIDRYTLEYTDKDLNEHYWGRAFENIYVLAGTQVAQGYPAVERVLTEGLDLLSGVWADDPLTVPRVKLQMQMRHVRKWLPSNPLECAKIWDQTGLWVRSLGMPQLTDIWQFHRATLEVQLLMHLERVDPKFAEWRMRVIAEYIADESISARHRSTALRCLTGYLHERRKTDTASEFVDSLRGGATPDYYYSRMLVALYGEGDWEKATDTLDRMNRTLERRALNPKPLKPSEIRTREKTLDLYYGNIFLPGMELQRRNVDGEY